MIDPSSRQDIYDAIDDEVEGRERGDLLSGMWAASHELGSALGLARDCRIEEAVERLVAAAARIVACLEQHSTPPCEHEWWVRCTSLPSNLIVECKKCKSQGTVAAMTQHEWAEAFASQAPYRPYRWRDSDRVIIEERA